ncbi:MAG: DUF4091 domain-containing protein [Clostridia bacterium]|nr:DUF4091 domain-containing protein [Clostridia bacterium]
MAIKILTSMEKCFLDEKICDKKEKNSFVMFKNEKLSFQVAYSFEGVYNALVSVKLEGSLAQYANIRQVVPVPVAYPVRNDTKCNSDCLRNTPGLYPDVIRPLHYNGQIKVIENQLQTLMIDVKLPQNAEISDGNLVITLVGNTFSESAEAKIHIVNAELPPQKLIHTEWFYTDCIAEAYHTEAFSEKHWKYIESFVKTAVDNGINMILTPVFTPELDTYIGGERMTTQLVDITVESEDKYSFGFSKLDRWIDMCLRLGVEYFEIPHFFTQWGAKSAPKFVAKVNGRKKKIFGWETDSMGNEYKNFLSQFIPALVGFLKEKGVDKNCYYHVSDEPNMNNLEQYKACKELIAPYLKEYNIIDALSHVEFYDTGVLENPIPSIHKIEDFIERKIPDLWAYYCGFGITTESQRMIAQSSFRTRILGVQLYKYNIVGFLHWGYNFYHNQRSYDYVDPFGCTDAEYFAPSGDGFLVYPGTDGEAWESLRLNSMREAMDDIRALELCESICGKEAVDKLISEGVDGELTFKNYPRNNDYLIELREKVALAIDAKLK